MPSVPSEHLLHQLVVGDAAAITAIVAASRTSDDPLILVAAALFAADAVALLARASERATTTRDRQLVAIATAHVGGQRDLVDHPDSVLVAWIAGARHRTSAPPSAPPTKEPS
jgi:hypothetical protein